MYKIILIVALLAMMAGFSPTGMAGTTNGSVVIAGIPHVLQKTDFCGEACAEMYLRKLGNKLTQDDVFNAARIDPILARGCYTPELKTALTSLGFATGEVFFRVNVTNLNAELGAQWQALYADLSNSIPTIVCMHSSSAADATEHFRLVTGYDAGKDEVIYHEPAEKDGAYQHISKAEFLACWPLKYGSQSWMVVRFKLAPGKEIKSPPAKSGFTAADYAQHIIKLKQKIPDKGFTIIIEKPFVVVGNEEPQVVKMRAEATVKWAVDKLKQAYFRKDPPQIIDVWLFMDDATYMKYAQEIFGDKPTTPFGYSSTEHHALVMNIETGGGTLVHEIVHPFMEANFPNCPAWLNEGLGSLYEQAAERNGAIIGLTNWRLAGLQQAIRNGEVSSFKMLTGANHNEFYTEDRGLNYAQARYLCYYLQEKELLNKFYHRFVANRREDPTGYNTLQAVLGEKDMAAFKTKWEKFVLFLKFP